VNPIRQRLQQFCDRVFDGFSLSVRHIGQQSEASLAFGERQQRLLLAFTDDSVEFPVTPSLSPIGNGRTLVNRNPVAQLAAQPVISSVAFTAQFFATQVTVQVTALTLVLTYILVYPFMSNADALLTLKPASDLFGTPILPEQELHQPPRLINDPRPNTASATSLGQLPRLLRSVAAKASPAELGVSLM
jgi:hypothetical protein